MAELDIILKRVEAIDPEFARLMRADPTKVTRLPVDFLRNGRIYHIASNGRYGPRLMTLGIVEPDFAVSLGGNPDGFVELARRAGLLFDTPDRRDRYARTFLDTTKNLARRTQFIDKFPALRETNQTTPQELQRFHETKTKYGPMIKPLRLSEQQPWKGKAYALVLWDLVEYDVTLTEEGKMEVKTTVLEPGMPTCIDLGQGPPPPLTRPTTSPELAPAPATSGPAR
jgi:hypothetical protein